MEAQIPQQVTRVSSGFTRLSRVVAALLATGLAMGLLLPSSRQYLALVPGRTIPMVWNLVTCAFIETNILQALLSIAAVLLMSRRIEPVYSTKNYATFLLVVAFISGLSMFTVQFMAYYIHRQGKLLFAEYYGFHGVLGGLLVAVRHVMPGADVALFGAIRIPTRYIPGIYLLVCGVWAYFKGPLFVMPPAVAGVLSGWLYLRYFQSTGTSGLRGDPSEDFRLATFFPAFLEPALDALFDGIARIFCMGSKSGSQAPASTAASTSGTSEEASRRRQRGAKALEERLASKGSSALAKLTAEANVSQSAPSQAQVAEGQGSKV